MEAPIGIDPSRTATASHSRKGVALTGNFERLTGFFAKALMFMQGTNTASVADNGQKSRLHLCARFLTRNPGASFAGSVQPRPPWLDSPRLAAVHRGQLFVIIVGFNPDETAALPSGRILSRNAL